MSDRAALAAATALLFAPLTALAAPADCAAPPALTAIAAPLDHSAALIEAGKPVLIVAVGSSSTAGTGASGPAETYPSRLQADLRQRLPGGAVRVLNRGKGGEDSPEELARLGRDVVAAHPDLVIWQVGTNAVLRRDNLGADAGLLQQGVGLLKSDGVDVVLMDLQYAPRVLMRRSYPVMERLIGEAAERERVGLFHRFAVMRYWQEEGGRFGAPLVGADGLHMTDASYGCLAGEVADALMANWSAHAKLRRRPPAAPAAVARLVKEPRAVPADASR